MAEDIPGADAQQLAALPAAQGIQPTGAPAGGGGGGQGLARILLGGLLERKPAVIEQQMDLLGAAQQDIGQVLAAGKDQRQDLDRARLGGQQVGQVRPAGIAFHKAFEGSQHPPGVGGGSQGLQQVRQAFATGGLGKTCVSGAPTRARRRRSLKAIPASRLAAVSSVRGKEVGRSSFPIILF